MQDLNWIVLPATYLADSVGSRCFAETIVPTDRTRPLDVGVFDHNMQENTRVNTCSNTASCRYCIGKDVSFGAFEVNAYDGMREVTLSEGELPSEGEVN